MKKILYTLLAITLLASCKTEKPVDYAIISGKVTNAKTEKLFLQDFFDFNIQKEIPLKEDGSFLDTIKFKDGFYRLMEDKNHRNRIDLYLKKGEHVMVNYDSDKKDATASITGNINNYVFNKNKLLLKLDRDGKELYSKNEEDFKKSILDIKTAMEKTLAETKGLPEDFRKTESKMINYKYLTFIFNYENAHRYFTGDKDFKASDFFSNELKNLSYEDEDAFKFFGVGYRHILSYLFERKGNQLAEKDSVHYFIAHANALGSIKSDLIRNMLLFTKQGAQLNILDDKDREDYYDVFMKYSTDSANNKKMTDAYDKIKSLSKGATSPKFVDYINHAGGTTSLDDLKGKYVYIDVWATWCGPCIAEIPSLKKVEKQFHDKNIAFVSISVDEKKAHEKWKEMVTEKELGGIQLIADNALKSEFIEGYGVNGIPHFILIDPQGNIVKSNAPRPSDEGLIELFNSLNL